MLFCTVHTLNAQTILPTPEVFIVNEGEYRLPRHVMVSVYNTQSTVLPFLKDILKAQGGSSMSVSKNQSKGDIVFILDKSKTDEAYELTIHPKKIEIRASGESGFFYAIQSINQLLIGNSSGKLPCAVIKDAPRYKLRSFLLDSGRQYQKVSTIKKYLDMMAMLKMNTFHWHLTEGLGWRLEIKKYPELTRKGAFVGTDAEQQGFYTQEDVKEIIRYASARNITVMPEIDMPGHAEAALTAYPQFSCFGQSQGLKKGQAFSENIFCAGKPQTMTFLKEVLNEVCELFPSKYIHVGGDEAPKGNWNRCPDCQALIKRENLKNSEQLQAYFSADIAGYLKSKGKKAVFWDEVLNEEDYELPDNVVVHWWGYRARKEKPLFTAIKKGYEVICGTNYYTYLNFPLTPWKGYQENRTVDIRQIYEQNPSMNRDSNSLVIGMSCALWTDDNVRESMIDQRLFPRIFALSEQMWHKGNNVPFEDFYNKVQNKKSYFEQLGYQFGPGLRSEVPVGYKWD